MATMTMTPEQVEQIAENASEKAAEKAVRNMLVAIGFDLENLHEEQQVWAWARTMHNSTRWGVRAIVTSLIGTIITAIAGWLWLAFGKH